MGRRNLNLQDMGTLLRAVVEEYTDHKSRTGLQITLQKKDAMELIKLLGKGDCIVVRADKKEAMYWLDLIREKEERINGGDHKEERAAGVPGDHAAGAGADQ